MVNHSPAFLIASDLHGDLAATDAILSRFEAEGAERLILLGDILYHGPRNDLPEGYDPKAVIAMLSQYADKLFCVRGNCDTEVDQMVLDFPVLADYAVIPAGERLIYATHGHVFNTKTPPPLCPGDILLHGHTHVPAADPQILPKGTGYVTDLGMTGPRNSVLGIQPELSIAKFRGDLAGRYQWAEGPTKLEAVLFTIDTATGLCKKAERVDCYDENTAHR